MAQKLPQPLQAGMDEKSDVTDTESRHRRDLPIAEIILKFEPQALRLIVRQAVEKAEDLGGFLAIRRRIVGTGIGSGKFLHRRGVQAYQFLPSAQPVERPVPAD